MRYYLIGPDGAQYGPADINILRQWVKEGRVNQTTPLVEEGSLRPLRASEIPGLFETPSGYPSSPWSSAPSPYPRGASPASHADDSLIVGAYVVSSLGLFFVLPIIGPLIGCFLAQRAQTQGHPGGKPALIFSAICLGINCLLCLTCLGIFGVMISSAPP